MAGKVAVMTDSNSGITPEQGKELGVFVLPMPFMVNGETYLEHVELTQEEFYQRLKEDAEISTSQPAAGSVLDFWNQALESGYEEIVYIPMSSGLSGSCQTAVMLSQDYDGKVQVVDNQRVSVTMRQSVIDAKLMADRGMSASEIRQKLEETKFDSSIYIMLDTLKYLKKGGRITPAAAAMGTILRLKPVLQIQGEKLDAYAKARNLKQAKSIMLDAMEKDFKERFSEKEDYSDMKICVVHSNNLEEAMIFKKEVEERFPGHDVYVDCLALSIACHIGSGALAIACTKDIL